METVRGTRGPILLAPAGSLPAVGAALSAGADAVYVGCRRWSRGGERVALPDGEIREAAAMCREAGARLHAAMNTVPAAAELPSFRNAVARMRDAGVFAVILADPGLISLVRREVRDLRITASVGLSALNPPDARFYRDLGADAVVLPTAVSPQEVPAIRSGGGLGVEVFVRCRPEILLQGKCALTGYLREEGGPPGRPTPDGMCGILSAKRSGRCLLACREIPLSRELHSIEDAMDPWIAAGVDVFKIQGRELPPPLLSATVSRIRGKLDAAVARVAGIPTGGGVRT
jgi:putative protease